MSSKQDNESYHDQDRNQLEQPVDSNNSSMGFDIESADYLNLKSIAITWCNYGWLYLSQQIK